MSAHICLVSICWSSFSLSLSLYPYLSVSLSRSFTHSLIFLYLYMLLTFTLYAHCFYSCSSNRSSWSTRVHRVEPEFYRIAITKQEKKNRRNYFEAKLSTHSYENTDSIFPRLPTNGKWESFARHSLRLQTKTTISISHIAHLKYTRPTNCITASLSRFAAFAFSCSLFHLGWCVWHPNERAHIFAFWLLFPFSWICSCTFHR